MSGSEGRYKRWLIIRFAHPTHEKPIFDFRKWDDKMEETGFGNRHVTGRSRGFAWRISGSRTSHKRKRMIDICQKLGNMGCSEVITNPMFTPRGL
jgi:hypothetical protein